MIDLFAGLSGGITSSEIVRTLLLDYDPSTTPQKTVTEPVQVLVSGTTLPTSFIRYFSR